MAKKVTSNKAANIVVQNITIKSNNRQSSDIQTWRDAIKSFENILNPNRVRLYDLYADILLDGHMEAVWGKRQDAITNKELTFTRDGKTDEEIEKILNSPDMRQMLKDLHDSILWGYTLLQVNSITYNEDEERYEINYDLIPRKHVHPEKEFQCISKEQNSVTRDILFKEPPLSKYCLWAGGDTDMGLMIKAAQYVIYKRGNFGDWAQFAELFGMPFREARYEDYDEDTRGKLEQAMENYGGNAWAVLPKSADFKLHDAVKGTAGSLYKLLHDACNAEISKCILGNTLTTEQGENGARSLGEVHQDVEDAKHLSDLKFLNDILNTKFKAILKAFGFNVAAGQIGFKGAGLNWEAVSKAWNVLKEVRKEMPVDDDYIYDELQIPKPDDYEKRRKAMDEEKTASNANLIANYANLSIPPVGDLVDADRKNLIQRIVDFFV